MYTNIFDSSRLVNLLICLVFIVVVSCGTSLAASRKTLLLSSYAGTEHLSGSHRNQIRNKREQIQRTKDLSNKPNAELPPEYSQSKKNEPEIKLTTDGSSKDKINCSQLSNINKTECLKLTDEDNIYKSKSIFAQMTENRGMLLRTLYVTIGVTGIVVVYFVARSVWLRKKHTKSRTYGVMAQSGNHRDMEMEPLGDGNDDDDDDYTVFEARRSKK